MGSPLPRGHLKFHRKFLPVVASQGTVEGGEPFTAKTDSSHHLLRKVSYMVHLNLKTELLERQVDSQLSHILLKVKLIVMLLRYLI